MDLNNLCDWTAYLPYYIGLYRWFIFFVFKFFPSFFYRLKKNKNTPVTHIVTTNNNEAIEETTILNIKPIFVSEADVTVVIPVYALNDSFMQTIGSILQNNPYEIIIVARVTVAKQIKTFYRQIHNIKIIIEDIPGKRQALVAGIKAVKTEIVVLVDDDVVWQSEHKKKSTLLQNLIAPFHDSRDIAGIGCLQKAIVGCCDPFGVLMDMRLAVRTLELRATTVLDKGCSCISGRTACYRTNVIQNEELYDYLLNERFCGVPLISGDDKCISRYLLNKGYKTYHQLGSGCKLKTKFILSEFVGQMVRWSRNTLRSDIKALFIERKIWCNNPFTAFILFDKLFTPFFVIYGLLFLPIYAIINGHYDILLVWVIWLMISRIIKLIYYFISYPYRIIYLPLFLIMQWIQSILKIYALFTICSTSWITKDVTQEIISEKKTHIDTETEEKKKTIIL